MNYEEYLDKYVSYDKILFRRCWAAAIDYAIFYVLVILYGYLFGKVNVWYFHSFNDFKFNVDSGIAMFIIWFLYFPIFEAMFGYTLGKGLFDLKVIQEKKNDLLISVTLRRHLLDIIDFFFFFGIVAVLMVKFTEEHKRIGDYVANSRVILDDESTS